MASSLTTTTTTCIICFDPIENDDFALMCGHRNFHSVCLKSWWSKHWRHFGILPNCPMCRTPVLRHGIKLPPRSDIQQHNPSMADCFVVMLCALIMVVFLLTLVRVAPEPQKIGAAL
jgi:hypothetical protein